MTNDEHTQDLEDRKRLHDATRRLHRHRTELGKLEQLKQVEINRIEMWFEDMASGELREIARLENEIEAWAREHRTDRVKSWDTPWGRISTVAKKGELKVDDPNVFDNWCRANGYAKEPALPKPDVKTLRAAANLDDEGRLIVDGEIVPGAHVDTAEGFNVHITVTGD